MLSLPLSSPDRAEPPPARYAGRRPLLAWQIRIAHAPTREVTDEARAVHALIRLYRKAGLVHRAAVSAAWCDCALCFGPLFPGLSK